MHALLAVYAVSTMALLLKRVFINFFAGMTVDAKEGAATTAAVARRRRNLANDLENSFDLPLYWGAYVAVFTANATSGASSDASVLRYLFPIYVTSRFVHAFFHLTDTRPAPGPRSVMFLIGLGCNIATCCVLLSTALQAPNPTISM